MIRFDPRVFSKPFWAVFLVTTKITRFFPETELVVVICKWDSLDHKGAQQQKCWMLDLMVEKV